MKGVIIMEEAWGGRWGGVQSTALSPSTLQNSQIRVGYVVLLRNL